MGFAFSGITKRRLSYFCRSNCYPSNSTLMTLYPKLMLFVYFKSDGFSIT